ncbi:predicted protein [Scheffersomyces stipitis CBS 6054]|uniref:DUF221-domain-containing protein n=1 Tax=Scheffersomyces stipitis (strain ATCC 58785 / CBS 6054 / NBRC 10063 / NRRL Y-11545) TaxID=322104 RepID=A3LTU0_PICST|nr:predicted protein [Scheffersomyces stipitis CBS 6054]ABN66474.1 predicted protein [Scheffersomyces stipitis CBS 6054]
MSDSSTSSDSSVSQFLAALIPTAVIAAVFILLFIAIRKKQKRVYEPRSIIETVPKDLQTESTPTGLFSWAPHVLKKSESYLIQQAGIDGYFFIRFLLEFGLICILGCFITWPILFPVNATNSNGQKGFNAISYSNVNNKWRFLAHIFVSWIFFGSVLFLIYREIVYYTTFRHAVQTTPLYDSLLSSRTLLLTEIPESLYEEETLRSYFPPAKTIWYARDYKKLEKDVKERTKLAGKYEGAANKVIIKAVKMRNKAIKKKKPTPEPADEIDKYLKDGKKRPTHRLKFLIGKKVDTLNYGVERLGELNTSIKEQQENFKENKQVPSVFIEFPTQLDLQLAYQAVPFNKDLKGVRRFSGLAPSDIIWENLPLTKKSRWAKKVVANTVLTLMIIFWAIPVAVVGAISNINFLTDKVHFLRFIDNMPAKLMGIITGLLPVVALAILMSLVPPFIKKMGKVAGCITIQEVNGFCQAWFFAFQVVHSFLVVTVTSAAASSVTSIISKPGTALQLLSSNLPKASNFYLAFFCLQGLTIPSGLLLQIVPLILSQVFSRLASTPRAKWNVWYKIGSPDWSTTYPAYQLLAVIGLCYAIIAPLVLGFAGIAFLVIYLAYIYTLVYVLQPNPVDARGRNYPRGLLQLFVGLYLAEVCLTAMFVFGKNWVSVALEALTIPVTVAVHLYLKWKYLPLWETVPISAIRYAAGNKSLEYPMHDQGYKEIKTEGTNYWEGGNELGAYQDQDVTIQGGASERANESGPESKVAGSDESDKHSPFDKASELEGGKTAAVGQVVAVPGKGVSWLTKFFKPKSETFDIVRAKMPACYFNYIEYNDEFVKTAYADPSVTDEEPHIWIVKDNLGLSDIEMNRAIEGGVDVSNSNTEFNEKGSATYTGPPPSYEEALKV